ncbi:hypothetical protein ACJMK2_026975 [Sinanodonta woodiana]|uniref:Tetraspanin n=1 Tax=Sinanodonta woodiana TaxID=1069815 RepID=A0ABD3XLA6_SINWO
MCTKERCIRISFIILNIFLSAYGVALLTGSCIIRYDQNMADSYIGYASFQKALESVNYSVQTPSSLNIGETLDAVCIVFIVIGVLFILIGMMGIIAAFVRLKSLLITYAVVLLVLVVLELICVLLVTTLRGKLEGWIKDGLKDSIRNNYSGINGSDVDTLRWNVIMHSFQCCGVDRYTDFRALRPLKWSIDVELGSIVTGKQFPFACCKVKNNTNCVLSPSNTTAFIDMGCYQVMRNWVTNNTGVIVALGVIILVTELVLVVFAFVRCCLLQKKAHEKDGEMNPILTYKLPQVHLVSRNRDRVNPSDVFMNPVYDGPTIPDESIEIYPPRRSRELLNHYNEPRDTYNTDIYERDSYTDSLSQIESSLREPSQMSYEPGLSSDYPYAKAIKRELRTQYPERTAVDKRSAYFGAPPSENC